MSEYEKNISRYNLEKEKKDRLGDSVIWIGLTLIFGFLFVFSLYHHIEETLLNNNGNSIEVSYTSDSSVVTYKADNGATYRFNNVNPLSVHNGNKITMYYFGDKIADAQPLNSLWFWIGMDSCWGGLVIICIYKAYIGIKMTQHYKGERI